MTSGDESSVSDSDDDSDSEDEDDGGVGMPAPATAGGITSAEWPTLVRVTSVHLMYSSTTPR